MKYSFFLTLLCLPAVFLSPFIINPPVGENEDEEVNSVDKEEFENGSGLELPKSADEDDDDEDPEMDINDVNKMVEQNLGGPIKDQENPHWEVVGDIMYRSCEEKARFGGSECEKPKSKSSKKDITTRTKSVWPLPVPYTIDGLEGKPTKVIQKAFDEFNLKTCITFRKKTSKDSNYLRYYKGNGCNSAVGRYPGSSKHDISLDDGCHHKNIAIHETMHALGFYHEQSRADRDKHVTINWGKIDLSKKGKRINFGKETVDVTTYGFNYDYRSTMHYIKTAFGKKNYWGFNEETITPAITTELGQCKSCGLSRIDALQLNARYCNETKKTVSKTNLTKEVKRWMAIYHGDSNDDFRHTLLEHLSLMYPHYYFTVSSYKVVRGFDEHKIIADHCLWVWNYYNRNLVVCYTRKDWKKYLSDSKVKEIMKKIVDEVKERGCNAETIANAANSYVKKNGHTRAGVHVVIHGHGLRTTWTGRSGFENFNCNVDQEASLVITFGST